MLASLALSGWFLFLLCRQWLAEVHDQPPPPALVCFMAGRTFAFSAYHMGRVGGGHLPMADTHWLVLALYGLDAWLARQSLRHALLAGLGVALAALSSWYYGFMLALTLPVYALARGGLSAHLRSRRAWLEAAVGLLTVIVLCGPFLVQYVPIMAEGAATTPLSDVAFWAASPLDYLVPNAHHPLWGAAVQSLLWPFPDREMPYEFRHALGWLALLLAFIGARGTAGGRSNG